MHKLLQMSFYLKHLLLKEEIITKRSNLLLIKRRFNYFDASGEVLDTVIENHIIDFVSSTSQFSWKEQGMILLQNKTRIHLQNIL